MLISLKNKESKLFSRRRNSVIRGLLVVIPVLGGLCGFAQNQSPVVFGKVTAADFAVAFPGLDTSADAVVISDVGIKTFEQRSFSAMWDGYLKRTKRILILKKRGFEAATVTLPLQAFKMEDEEITEFKAATYNLEGGRVVKTELDKNSIFKIKVSENWMAERFTFPAVREGSIIEYTYTQKSPFVLNNHSWSLQSIYPCLWSEYEASIPPAFSYSVVKHSPLPFCIETTEAKQAAYGRTTYGEVKTFHWAAKDVPAMKEEPFTTTVNNYLAGVDVRITGFETQGIAVVHDPGTRQNAVYLEDIRYGGVLFSWLQLDRQLLQTDHFGADLTAHNSWLDKDMQEITAGTEDDLSKAKRIYAYVRDNFSCNTHPGYLMTNTLKSVFKAKSGSEAELNLLLTAMLDHEKLKAFPVVLSTRSNGLINELMPQASALNYTVCKFRYGALSYYLDASDPDLRFGQLPLECYNGYDVVVDTAVRYPEVNLSADSVTEQKKVVVFISNGDKGGLDGSVQSYPGVGEAAEIRKKMKDQDGEKKFRDQLRNGLTSEVTISDLEIDSLRLPDEPLVINYSCHVALDSASDILYFTPMLADRLTDNPFKDAVRIYPVEMPSARDVNYILTMDVPSGFVVEEMPKSIKILLNDGGYFEYILTEDGDQIHFRTRIRLMRANYQPQEYTELRAFFAAIVKKENEQIVFKKKK
jgi:hypothetical protein